MYIFLICSIAMFFFVAERTFPGRQLPNVTGWYARAILLNACQVVISYTAGVTWESWMQSIALVNVLYEMPIVLQGLIGWFIGTFVFYWWHRLRHESDFLWRALHQIHHSAGRIEMMTAFYKHPLEITINSVLISIVLFPILGLQPEAAIFYNIFAATGEFFYHSNIKTPHFMGYFLQRPEHHSIHHQYNVHRYNYGDITWWDRIFGTFKDSHEFADRCGFNQKEEVQLGKMLVFKDVFKK